MSNASAAKGKNFEAACVQYLRDNGFPQAARTLAGAREDRGDVSGTPIVIQCKNHNRIALSEWMKETAQQADNAGLVGYALWHKRKGTADIAEQYVTIPAWFFVDLLKDYE